MPRWVAEHLPIFMVMNGEYMNIYRYNGQGHYIGSVAIVVADDKSEAILIVGEELRKSGLEREANNLTGSEFHLVEYEKGLIYFDSGDY